MSRLRAVAIDPETERNSAETRVQGLRVFSQGPDNLLCPQLGYTASGCASGPGNKAKNSPMPRGHEVLVRLRLSQAVGAAEPESHLQGEQLSANTQSTPEDSARYRRSVSMFKVQAHATCCTAVLQVHTEVQDSRIPPMLTVISQPAISSGLLYVAAYHVWFVQDVRVELTGSLPRDCEYKLHISQQDSITRQVLAQPTALCPMLLVCNTTQAGSALTWVDSQVQMMVRVAGLENIRHLTTATPHIHHLPELPQLKVLNLEQAAKWRYGGTALAKRGDISYDLSCLSKMPELEVVRIKVVAGC